MIAAQSLANIVAHPVIGIMLDLGASYGAVGAGLGALVLPGCALWLLWKPPPMYEAPKPAGEGAAASLAA
jgi:hypothetical protein